MSKQRLLQAIDSIEARARHIVGGAAGTAIDGILAECTTLRVLLASDVAPAVALADPAPQSSVEIETMAKGTPKVKVKVYHEDPAEALVAATTLYDQAVAKYDRSESGKEA